MDIERFIPARNLEVLRRVGLHKVAGAMYGIDEMTLKEAVAIAGAQVYVKNAQNKAIFEGLQSLAALRGEKVAESPWGPLLMRSLGPAAVGGLGGYLASPNDPDAELRNVGAGALTGGTLGLLNTLRRGFAADPSVATALHTALSGLK